MLPIGPPSSHHTSICHRYNPTTTKSFHPVPLSVFFYFILLKFSSSTVHPLLPPHLAHRPFARSPPSLAKEWEHGVDGVDGGGAQLLAPGGCPPVRLRQLYVVLKSGAVHSTFTHTRTETHIMSQAALPSIVCFVHLLPLVLLDVKKPPTRVSPCRALHQGKPRFEASERERGVQRKERSGT